MIVEYLCVTPSPDASTPGSITRFSAPHAAIDDTERAPSLLALAVLTTQFRDDHMHVADFLDATAAALRAAPDDALAIVH